LKSAFVVILAVGVMASLGGLAWGQSDFDYSKVTRLRWMDPERNPITYQEYVSQREFAGEFGGRLVYSGRKGDTPICIVVNNLLYFAIDNSFSVFLSDLEQDGYTPSVYTAMNNGDETALKGILISERSNRSIAGAILIGDLPVAWYEMNVWGEEEFPIDLYFMDLDGRWFDRDSDGLYDEHEDGSGDLEADIWVGRLLAFNLTQHGAHEATMVNNYLDKNHRYRTGELRLQDKALAYIDNDWCMYGWEDEVALAYPVTDAVIDPYETTREDYMQRVRESTGSQYENLLICSHSSPWVHALYWGDEPYDYSLFHNHEIEQIDVQVLFYNLFACSNSRFVEEDDMGSWYVFQSQYGLVSLGSTKTGSMLCFFGYYEPLGDGAAFGEAFLSWCIDHIETCAGDDSRPWFYGMTLSGDPTLKADHTGDANSDGAIDLGDLVFLTNYLFRGGDAPDPLRLGDPSADCAVNLGDVVFLLNYLYRDGPAPGIGCA
jgi:hypothetical protein